MLETIDLPEWVEHVKSPTDNNTYWCGANKKMCDSPFLDVNHALNTTMYGSRLQVCPLCVDNIIKKLSEGAYNIVSTN